VAAAFFAVGAFFPVALIILFAGFLDMLDGQVARAAEPRHRFWGIL